MEDLIKIEDPVTVFLVLALLLMGVVPGVVLLVWRVTRLPFKVESLRWVYLGWALLLAASSVWNLTRNVRYSVEEAGADNFLRLAFLTLGLLIVMFVSFKHRLAFVPELFYGALGIFFVFSLWGAMSVLWSVAPAITLYKSLEYCAMLLLLGLTVSLIRHGVREPHNRLLALKSVFDWNWCLVFVLLVSVYVGILIWPEYAIRENKSMLGFSIEGALPGISANGVGQLAALMGIVAVARLLFVPRARRFYLPLLVFSIVTMILAQSRSPILAFFVASFAVLVASRRFGLLGLVSAALGGLLVSAYSQTVVEFLRRGQTDGELMTLTGRIGFWETSLHAIRESPLAGFGAYAGGRYVAAGSLSGGEGPTTVHSLFVEVLVDTGILGLLLLLVGLGATWAWMLRLRLLVAGQPVGRLLWIESLGVLTVVSVRSVFSVPLVWSSNVLTFGLLLIFVSVLRRQLVRGSSPGVVRAQQLQAGWWRRPGFHG